MKRILQYFAGLSLIGGGGWVIYLDFVRGSSIPIVIVSLAFLCLCMGFAAIFKPKLVKEIFLAWLP